jgi:hypothetical protein
MFHLLYIICLFEFYSFVDKTLHLTVDLVDNHNYTITNRLLSEITVFKAGWNAMYKSKFNFTMKCNSSSRVVLDRIGIVNIKREWKSIN